MSLKAHVPDRFTRSVQGISDRAFIAHFTGMLSPGTEQELARRRAHLLALILVAIVWSVKHVTGLTEGSAQYTVYGLAIVLAAMAGGFAPAAAATLAAVLLVNVDAPASLWSFERMAFAIEGLGLALVVDGVKRRLTRAETRLAAVDGANQVLNQEARRARISRQAFEQLEETAVDSAAFVVNAHGLIVEWPASATRVYGYTAEDVLGSPVSAVLGESWRPLTTDELSAAAAGEPARRSGVHRRSDGTPLHAAFAIRRCGFPDHDHFTVAVRDLARQRETDAFREAALRAQSELQRAVDMAQAQVETLETLTDPAISLAASPSGVDDLLARLRSALRAEGVALVRVGRNTTRLVAAAGLQPTSAGKSNAPAGAGSGDARVVLVHNDAARVAQVSALQWPSTVESILVVPIRYSGPVAFRMEIVNERRARATEWDLALARIVADRLASAMPLRTPADSADAVA